MFRFQSFDNDCTLEEEEEEGLVDDEDEIDQFNDDTFGAGAIDDDWQEEHARLAELDEKDGLLGGGDASPVVPPPPESVPLPSSLPPPPTSALSPLGSEDKAGDDLAESLAYLILDSDPAIAEVGAAELNRSCLPSSAPPNQALPPGLSAASRSLLSYQQKQHLLHRGTVPLQQINSHSIWENNMGFGPVSVTHGLVTHMEESPLLSMMKELPNGFRQLAGRRGGICLKGSHPLGPPRL
ncbi:hypothetical protein AMELA_G00271540 [Ameiurus melas]|uniref:Uncharacterized protein n=1 Tax=Ameiurus melas TaxID=219545 RepID=A0A7J5ZNW8_AMEME|nr:hypothetical protein AMELA_G00271540 [Ameiurus melas]